MASKSSLQNNRELHPQRSEACAGARRASSSSVEDGTEPAQQCGEIRHLSLSLATVTEGIAHIGDDGRYTAANRAYAEMLGCSPEHLVGEFWEHSVGCDNQPAARDARRRMDQQGKAEFTARFRRKDGGQRTCNVVLYPSAEGKSVAHYCLMEDVTERKRLERQVIESVLDQQRRIGHELQEGLIQQLAGLRMMARSLHQQILQHREADCVRTCEQFADLIADAQSQAKSIIKGLRPVEVDSNGLMAALRDLAESAERRTGVTCTFECEGEIPVENATTATQLFYIAKDAIFEIAGQTGVSKTLLSLGRREGRIVLIVSGIGAKRQSGRDSDLFSTSPLIMQYRADMIGANLEVSSAGDGGLSVVCRL